MLIIIKMIFAYDNCSLSTALLYLFQNLSGTIAAILKILSIASTYVIFLISIIENDLPLALSTPDHIIIILACFAQIVGIQFINIFAGMATSPI